MVKAEGSIQTFVFGRDGLLPNNPKLPAVLYRGALINNPQDMEQLFNDNGWLNSWQNGVFGYHHYHSNAHEALGVIAGSARLQIGGDAGMSLEVYAGDVLILPAGTAHKCLSRSSRFLIAGAYPDGMSYNTRRATAEDLEAALPEIPEVPRPASDPVYGPHGPLLEAWGIPGVSSP
ncbi:cupin domain-containing protein [Paenibacillus sp. S150]|uniref:cupin domain-containing protein n=1 Tax=Paenibacillus sp. S150 TaxID=2749826 RepID=UPI001C577C2E|nr:cupin domain-containing protein [Paenibacillus sp. S150]MBW4080637.1 cupin domain-containing protein [Paenibacillus sp. S150]